MFKMVMIGVTRVTQKVDNAQSVVVVVRSPLFNFPKVGRCMRHPSTMGHGVSEFNTLIEEQLTKRGELFTLSLYKHVQSDLYTKNDVAFVDVWLKEQNTIIDKIKSAIKEHFGDVEYIDCGAHDAGALLTGIC